MKRSAAPCGVLQEKDADYVMETPVQPQYADHCYNGIVFDVQAEV